MLQKNQETGAHSLRTVILKKDPFANSAATKFHATHLPKRAEAQLKEKSEALRQIQTSLLDSVQILQEEVPHLRLPVQQQELEALPRYYRATVFFIPSSNK